MYWKLTSVISEKNKRCPFSTFGSPIFVFPIVASTIVYKPSHGTKWEMFFFHIIYKNKVRTLAGKNTFPFSFVFTGRVIFIFQKKIYGSDPLETDIKAFIAAINEKQKTRDQMFSIGRKILKCNSSVSFVYKKVNAKYFLFSYG